MPSTVLLLLLAFWQSLAMSSESKVDSKQLAASSWTKKHFFEDVYWYDLHGTAHAVMIPELVKKVPPLSPGYIKAIKASGIKRGDQPVQVLDLCCGSGLLTLPLVQAYPDCQMTILDAEADRVAFTDKKLRKKAEFTNIKGIVHTVDLEKEDKLPGGPYDVIVSTMSLHHIVPGHGEPDPKGLTPQLFLKAFKMILNSLNDGGHFVFGENMSRLTTFQHLQLMNHAGFSEVDVAWKKDDLFIAAGRKLPAGVMDAVTLNAANPSAMHGHGHGHGGGQGHGHAHGSGSGGAQDKKDGHSHGPTTSSPGSGSQQQHGHGHGHSHGASDQKQAGGHQHGHSVGSEHNQHGHSHGGHGGDHGHSHGGKEADDHTSVPPKLPDNVEKLVAKLKRQGAINFAELQEVATLMNRDPNAENLWWDYQASATKDEDTGVVALVPDALDELLAQWQGSLCD